MAAVVTNAHVPNHAAPLLKQMDILLYNQPRKQTSSDHVGVHEACKRGLSFPLLRPD